jgi:hypothetical protein
MLSCLHGRDEGGLHFIFKEQAARGNRGTDR